MADVSYFRAVRETTITEKLLWLNEQEMHGENMFDRVGESIIPPHNIWVSMEGKLIAVDKVRCKVPFRNSYYEDFKNFGSIMVYNKTCFEAHYMPSEHVKIIKKLIEMPEHNAPNGMSYGELPPLLIPGQSCNRIQYSHNFA